MWWLPGESPFLEELVLVLCLHFSQTGLSAAIRHPQLPAKLGLPWCGLSRVSEQVVSAALICWAHWKLALSVRTWHSDGGEGSEGFSAWGVG